MRAGTTLVELLVVLCLLGLFGTVAIVAARPTSRPLASGARTHAKHQLDSLRSLVLRAGAQRTLAIDDSLGAHIVTLLPDGSVIADSLFAADLGVDRLTGRASK